MLVQLKYPSLSNFYSVCTYMQILIKSFLTDNVSQVFLLYFFLFCFTRKHIFTSSLIIILGLLQNLSRLSTSYLNFGHQNKYNISGIIRKKARYRGNITSLLLSYIFMFLNPRNKLILLTTVSLTAYVQLIIHYRPQVIFRMIVSRDSMAFLLCSDIHDFTFGCIETYVACFCSSHQFSQLYL